MSEVAAAIAEHFARTWAELRETIEKTPDDQWRMPDPSGDPYLTPARQALHTIVSVEAYMQRSQEEALSAMAIENRRFPIDWEDAPAEALPSRQEILAYLGDVAERLDERLRGSSDAAFAAASAFPWTGRNVAGHWLYGLRHTQHHVMNTILRTRGLAGGKWR